MGRFPFISPVCLWFPKIPSLLRIPQYRMNRIGASWVGIHQLNLSRITLSWRQFYKLEVELLRYVLQRDSYSALENPFVTNIGRIQPNIYKTIMYYKKGIEQLGSRQTIRQWQSMLDAVVIYHILYVNSIAANCLSLSKSIGTNVMVFTLGL